MYDALHYGLEYWIILSVPISNQKFISLLVTVCLPPHYTQANPFSGSPQALLGDEKLDKRLLEHEPTLRTPAKNAVFRRDAVDRGLHLLVCMQKSNCRKEIAQDCRPKRRDNLMPHLLRLVIGRAASRRNPASLRSAP